MSKSHSGFIQYRPGVRPVEPAALHAAAKKYYLLHRTGSTTGAPAFCVALRQSRPIASVENSRR